MAAREENLKKINDELEKLDDEQLEKVAGGQIVYMAVGDMKKEQEAKSDNSLDCVGKIRLFISKREKKLTKALRRHVGGFFVAKTKFFC